MDDSTPRARSGISLETLPHHPSNNENSKRPKKVRLACERCRYRRIKCDGQIPACSNCAKSGSVCIDVDSRNDLRVSRGFFVNACARIAWLEDIIRTQLPHVNLNEGPSLHGGSVEVGGATPSGNAGSLTTAHLVDDPTLSSSNTEPQYDDAGRSAETPYVQNAVPQSTGQTQGLKRPISSVQSQSSRESSVEQDTRSVALDLGLLSLNSDSRQLHYLGSSSGSLFASLVQAGRSGENTLGVSKAAVSPRDIDDSIRASHQGSTSSNSVQFDVMRTAVSSLYAQLRKDLPPRKDCDTLCNLFFSQLHPNHPFLHRPSFDWMVNSLYICAASETRCPLQHNGWPADLQAFDCNGEEHISNGRKLIPTPVHVAAFQVFLALSIGATLQIRRRAYFHNPGTFFNSAMSLSNYVFNSISLPSLQAILLLLVHSLVEPGGPDIWTLTHLAMAHSIDLGFHREVGDNMKFSRVAIEMRRRIFFSIYTFDRSISTIQGRPFSIGDDYFDTNLPSMDTNEGHFPNEGGSLDIPNDYEYMNYSIHLFKMSQLISKIKTIFYRLPRTRPFPPNLLEVQSQVRNELEQWLSEVPSVVLFAPADLKLRLTLKLRNHYHGAMCLLHQPSQAIVQPTDQALQICYENAAERLRLLETLYESGNLVHSWRTVHDVFLAGTTVMYCVWISKTVRDTVTLPVLASICRRCSSLLGAGGEWWPMIRKSRLSLERLASHTIEMFAEKSRPDSTSDASPTATSYLIHPAPVGRSPDWVPENITETLASVLNHDQNGQLSNIFESTPYNPFSSGISIINDAANNFDDGFWANLEDYVPNVIQE
ncbi:fungal-specific transcription factor domain-containing protein [Xylogone sp. PMI_703]|nr:fungal-specific transcription factor domain-containing protein [Xylogone sp. PMI_703]